MSPQNDFRLRDVGVRNLSDAELMTYLLGDRKLAEQALTLGLGNLHSLFLEEVEQKLPTEIAAKLLAAAELGRRIACTARETKPVVQTPQDAINILLEDMRYLKKEHFKALLLDTQMKVIGLEIISVGTLDTTVVHPREAFGPALRRSAAYVLFAHNHPSGDPTPSQADIDSTARLIVAGEVLGIEVMDHIVIGDGTYFSFREQGILWEE